MAESPEVPKPSEWSGVVPHFHFDLIGRIVPGAYLLGGGYWLLTRSGACQACQGNWTSSLYAAGLLLLIAAAAAYAVGFVIGPFSQYVFDRWCPLNEAKIPDYAKKAFEGATVLDKKDLHFHDLLRSAPQLAIMCSKWDAEAFAARQLGTMTIILVIALWGLDAWDSAKFGKSPGYVLALFLSGIALFVIVLCRLQFEHSRDKATKSRFMMCVKWPAAAEPTPTPAQQPPLSAEKASEAASAGTPK
jgi:hypothetical protein